DFLLSSFGTATERERLGPCHFIIYCPSRDKTSLHLYFNRCIFLIPRKVQLLFLAIDTYLGHLVHSVTVKIHQSVVPWIRRSHLIIIRTIPTILKLFLFPIFFHFQGIYQRTSFNRYCVFIPSASKDLHG